MSICSLRLGRDEVMQAEDADDDEDDEDGGDGMPKALVGEARC